LATGFARVCNKAELPRRDAETGKPCCTSHGLRKAAASRLAERGGTTTQLKAVFGWKTSSEADLYTEAAEREQAARDAAALKERTPIGKLKKKFAKNEPK
jgi:integrase